MIHQTHCKFCKSPLNIEIDDEYSKLGDPFKLLPFAACNRCADLRVRRRKVEHAIERVCARLCQGKVGNEERDRLRDILTATTKAYASLIADWIRASSPFWHEDCVDLLMDRPAHWPKILGQMWKLYENTKEAA